MPFERLTAIGFSVSRTALVAAGRRRAARFDLIYRTGHAFHALLGDDDGLAVPQTATHHLAAGGRFVFETRNSADRAWLGWTPETSKCAAKTALHGRIEQCHDAIHDPRTGIVELPQINRFLDQDGELVGRSRIRFIAVTGRAG